MNKKNLEFLHFTVLLIVMTSLSAMKGSLEVGIVDLVQGYLQGQMKMLRSLKIYVSRVLLLRCLLGRLSLFLVCFSSCNEKSTCRCWSDWDIFRSKFYDTCYYYVIPAILFWTPVFAF